MAKLVLIPTPIVEDSLQDITEHTKNSIQSIRYFVVENLRTARRVLRKFGYQANYDTEVFFFELNKHDKHSTLSEVEEWLDSGYTVGLMSEAGMPCIADPGNQIVQLAHKLNIEIEVLSGPSSILLALVSSGLNGQNFAFNGYLPIDVTEKTKKLKALESRVLTEGQTQLFMETPYRNQSLFEIILKTISPSLYLGIAAHIGGDPTIIQTKKISDWKIISQPQLHKLPTIFSLGI